MRYTFEEEFRLDHPETVGATGSHFDLNNYKDWLEAQLIEARKQLALHNAVRSLPPSDAIRFGNWLNRNAEKWGDEWALDDGRNYTTAELYRKFQGL